MKRVAFLVLKLAVAAALVAWLVHGGRLDFGALRVLVNQPWLSAVTLSALAFSIVVGALRWRWLLRLAEVDLPLARAIRLQMIGLFFNVALPGGIGGDVVKAIYVARDASPRQRPTIYLVGFVDRLIGVASLVIVALGALIARGSAAWRVPQLRELAIGVAILSVLTLVVPAVVIVILRRARVDSVQAEGSLLRRFMRHLLAAAVLVAARTAILAAALAVSVCLHVTGTLAFAALAHEISALPTPIADVFSVYPLGMLTLMVPISYAGIGVGHFAFERLFGLVGMADGASVFNVYFIAQTVPCLLGVIPYLAERREAGRPEPDSSTDAMSH